MCKITFPDKLMADKAGFDFIASLFHNETCELCEEIYMDLSSISYIDANLSAAIGAIFDSLKDDRKKKVLYFSPKSKGVRKILSRNHFLQSYDIKTTIDDSEKFIIFKRFNANEIDAFKQYVDDGLIHKKKFPTHTAIVAEKILESIFEIYVNAMTHGDSKVIYCCGEYNEKNSQHTLDMTIVDLGKTIPYNVNEYHRQKKLEQMSHCECLEWAFEKGNTTKSDTGGLGLSLLKEFIQLNAGTIQMVSGKGVLEISGKDPTHYELQYEFPGTIVNVKFNFDDTNIYYMKGESQENLKDLL